MARPPRRYIAKRGESPKKRKLEPNYNGKHLTGTCKVRCSRKKPKKGKSRAQKEDDFRQKKGGESQGYRPWTGSEKVKEEKHSQRNIPPQEKKK